MMAEPVAVGRPPQQPTETNSSPSRSSQSHSPGPYHANVPAFSLSHPLRRASPTPYNKVVASVSKSMRRSASAPDLPYGVIEEGAHSDAPKKRNRTTPEQLALLEEVFAKNTTPNAAVRDMLAEKLDMTPRSVQIWFQNRRAKMKLLDRKSLLKAEAVLNANAYPYGAAQPQRPVGVAAAFPLEGITMQQQQQRVPPIYFGGGNAYSGTAFVPPMYHPQMQPQVVATTTSRSPLGVMQPQAAEDISRDELMASLGLDLSGTDDLTGDSSGSPADAAAAMSHATSPSTLPTQRSVVAFDADRLKIGTWTRLRLSPGDLACRFDASREFVSWEIVEGPHRCKIEFSFDIIESIDIDVASEAVALLTVTLRSVPQFYLCVPGLDGQVTWRPCHDITEGQQASRSPRHVLQAHPAVFVRALSRLVDSHARLRIVSRVRTDVGRPLDMTVNASAPDTFGLPASASPGSSPLLAVSTWSKSPSPQMTSPQQAVATVSPHAAASPATSAPSQQLQQQQQQPTRSAAQQFVHPALAAVRTDRTMKKSASSPALPRPAQVDHLSSFLSAAYEQEPLYDTNGPYVDVTDDEAATAGALPQPLPLPGSSSSDLASLYLNLGNYTPDADFSSFTDPFLG